MTGTGWTFDYVRWELTWPDLLKLIGYWDEHPPVGETLLSIGKGVFGLKKNRANSQSLSELSKISGIKVTKGDIRRDLVPKLKAPTRPTNAR